MGRSECTLTTTQRQGIIESLPQLVEFLSSPVVVEEIHKSGYQVDWKAFSEMVEDVTGHPLIVKE